MKTLQEIQDIVIREMNNLIAINLTNDLYDSNLQHEREIEVIKELEQKFNVNIDRTSWEVTPKK